MIIMYINKVGSVMIQFGSMLGLSISIQILTGILVALLYCNIGDNNIFYGILSFLYVNKYITLKWHKYVSSLIFVLLYVHIFKNYIYKSYIYLVNITGFILFVMLNLINVLGYSLLNNNLSYWGITILVNFFTVLDFMINADDLVNTLSGFYIVNTQIIYKRILVLHVILPFVLLAVIYLHMMYLHYYNIMNNNSIFVNDFRVLTDLLFMFHYIRDIRYLIMFNATIVALVILSMVDILDYNHGILNMNLQINKLVNVDNNNFIISNPYNTPKNIQPEWYFLFVYFIVKTIKNKKLGIFCILLVFILLLSPLIHYKGRVLV